MARRKIAGSRALITGASSGIGRELARELSSRGARLIITARREDRLATLADEIRGAGGEAHAVAGDITDAEFRQTLIGEAQSRFTALELLVNNAGIGATGPFAEASEDRLRRIMEVNFFAPAELMRSAIPLLRRGRRPMLVNVSSVLAHRAVANKSEYCASKFALHGLSQALRAEFCPQGIEVLVVSPSTTESEFFDHLIEQKTDSPSSPFGPMKARCVAGKTARAIERGKHEIILTASGKIMVWLDRLAPRLMDYIASRVS